MDKEIKEAWQRIVLICRRYSIHNDLGSYGETNRVLRLIYDELTKEK